MVKNNDLRSKIKFILYKKNFKQDTWTSEDQEAWKTFCFNTPGFLHLAKKNPSELTVDNTCKDFIEKEFTRLKTPIKKEKPQPTITEQPVKKSRKTLKKKEELSEE